MPGGCTARAIAAYSGALQGVLGLYQSMPGYTGAGRGTITCRLGCGWSKLHWGSGAELAVLAQEGMLLPTSTAHESPWACSSCNQACFNATPLLPLPL